eukprot:gene10412-12785_t
MDKVIFKSSIHFNRDISLIVLTFLSIPAIGILNAVFQGNLADWDFAAGVVKSFLIITLLFIVIDYRIPLIKYVNNTVLIVIVITISLYLTFLISAEMFRTLSIYLVDDKQAGIFALREYFGLSVIMLFYKTCPILVFPLSFFLYSGSGGDESSDIKSGHFQSLVDEISKPGIIFFGQGVGSTYYSLGLGRKILQSELTYFELIRVFGLPIAILLFFLLLYPIIYLYQNSKLRKNKAYAVAYLGYLFIAGTNPLLISSTGMLIVVAINPISVCMATYNGAKYIEEQLKSILMQLGPHDELIIVDDCSTDMTLQKIGLFRDGRIKLTVNEKNSGVVKSFEKAINLSSNDIIYLSDQDDLWAQNKVSEINRIFQDESAVTLVMSNASIIDGNGAELDKLFYNDDFTSSFLKNLKSNSFLGCCMVFNKKAVKGIFPFPKEVPMHDYWISINHILYGKIIFINKPLVKYRRHGNNVFSQIQKGIMKVLVLLAAYNGGLYIEEQISSILNQEKVSVDIIISDDNSSDQTVDIIEGMMKQGSSITLIRKDKGSGSAAKNFMGLINLAVDIGGYEAVAFSDQDDIWLPEKLSSAVSVIKKDNVDLYASNLILWNESVGKKELLKKSFKQKQYDFMFEGASAGCTYVCSIDLFRHLRVITSGLNYENWPNFSHDWFMYFFARLNNYKVFIDERAFILYRIHNNNVHGHLNTFSFSSLRTRLRLVREGWYLGHIEGFFQLIRKGSKEETIYNLYQSGVFTRLYLCIRYNFQLMRNPVKFINFALLAFLFMLPVTMLVTVLLLITNKGNPFFYQVRPGKDQKLFKIIKFKTMNNRKDSFGVLLSDDQRITSVGSFVRKASLDELPQLINVIKGDMSLVGPRPLLPEYLPLYNEEQQKRHYVRPGITGWAQVNGRNAISWDKKFKYDVWYVNNLSFWLDMKIIWRTGLKVFRREGISQKGTAGKRVSLVRAFMRELKAVNPRYKVLTTDLNPSLSPACQVSDIAVKVKKISDPGYISELLVICKENNVKVVIPTIDTELELLSENKDLFSEHDKGIAIPAPIDKNQPTFPLFIKPYDGSLSKDIFLIKERSELTDYHYDNPKLMFMEYVSPIENDEYTVDMFYGRDNKLKCVVPRKRIEVRAGEISKGLTVKNRIVNYLLDKLHFISGAVGCLTLQLFLNKKNGQILGIEINPRFGGGYPLSYLAGANYPKNIIQEYLFNENLTYWDSWEDQLLMLRYDDEVIVHGFKNDTLYYEYEYLLSAYRVIACELAPLKAEGLMNQMLLKYKAGENVFQWLVEEGISTSALTIGDLLLKYREHQPNIVLRTGVKEVFDAILRREGLIGVLTDGRSISQRNKIKSLGIETYLSRVVISEEFGSEKPEISNYLAFHDLAEQRIYFGDNITKDFVSPNRLGWNTIFVDGDERKIYRHNNATIDSRFLAKSVIKDFTELNIL